MLRRATAPGLRLLPSRRQAAPVKRLVSAGTYYYGRPSMRDQARRYGTSGVGANLFTRRVEWARGHAAVPRRASALLLSRRSPWSPAGDRVGSWSSPGRTPTLGLTEAWATRCAPRQQLSVAPGQCRRSPVRPGRGAGDQEVGSSADTDRMSRPCPHMARACSPSSSGS